MIGKLESVVVDTRDPKGLATFCAELLGATTVVDRDDWVSIVDEEGRQVLGLGATRAPDAHEDGSFRVFHDPAGHPFCLVWD